MERFQMIITEERLAPYRRKGAPLSLLRGTGPYSRQAGLPPEWFSSSDHFLQSDWRTEPVDPQDPESGLQVVPVLAFVQNVPVLKPGTEWLGLQHQAGGYSCEQICMVATRLELREVLKPALNAIGREGYAAEAGHFYRPDILASRIARYVNALAELGLDCESSWRNLTESVYPIDATQDNLDRLAENAPDLDDLVDWSGFIRARYSTDPVILLLTENSD